MIIAKEFIWLHIPKTGGTHARAMFATFPQIILDQQYGPHMTSWEPNYKHDTIASRLSKSELSTDGKQVIANIRRLPNFIISHCRHVIDILLLRHNILKKKLLKNQHSMDTDALARALNTLKNHQKEAGLINRYLTDPEKLSKGLIWIADPDFLGLDSRRKNWNGLLPPLTCDFLLKNYIGKKGIDHWFRLEHLVDDFLLFMKRFVDISMESEQHLRTLPRQNVTRNNHKYSTSILSKHHLQRMYEANPLWAKVERAAYGATLAEV